MEWYVNELARIHATKLSGDYEAPDRLKNQVREALISLRGHVDALEPTAMTSLDPLDDVLLGRLLIASNFQVLDAMKLVRNYVDFRKMHGAFVMPGPETMSNGSFMMPFEDHRGRPVLLVRGKYLDPKVPVHIVKEYFRGMMDAMTLHFLRNRSGLSEENPLEQYICVFDTEGCGWSNYSLNTVKVFVQESALYCPEKLQEVVVLGASSFSRAIWKCVSPVLHPRTRQKVTMVASKDVATTMRRLVPLNKLPVKYGGEATLLPSPQEGQFLGLEGRAGAIAAAAWEFGGVGGADADEGLKEKIGGREARPSSNGCFCGLGTLVKRSKFIERVNDLVSGQVKDTASQSRGKTLGMLACYACSGPLLWPQPRR
jgi:hypothetical protein